MNWCEEHTKSAEKSALAVIAGRFLEREQDSRGSIERQNNHRGNNCYSNALPADEKRYTGRGRREAQF